jgi:NAD dependent epimerase/dehydratase family enzyme
VLVESRVQLTKQLAGAIAEARPRPRTLISASAVGYYGDRGGEVLHESSTGGTDFLAQLCKEWEAAARPRILVSAS